MSELSLTTNETKMLYACIRQGFSILLKIQDYRQFSLGELFPGFVTQWDDIKAILELGISKKIAWTGMSMTKSDNVPDDTRIPPNAEINSNTIRLMHAKAEALGVSLSPNYTFFDEDENFVEGAATWLQAVNAYLEIINLSQEAGLFKMTAADFEGSSASMTRSGAQLLIFDKAEVPLTNGGRWCEEFNALGIQDGSGSFYDDFFFKTVNELIEQTLPTLEVFQTEQTATKQADPDYPSTHTRYSFWLSGYSLIGMLRVKTTDDEYLTTPVFDTPNNGHCIIDTAFDDAANQATAKLFGIRMVEV